MKNHKYYYVIFGSGWDLYKQSYSDLNKVDDAIYISDEIIRRNVLRRFHLGKVNNYVDLPLKGLWNGCYFKNPFPEDRELCFVFFRNWLELDKQVGLISYLKLNYPGAKFVFFLQDLFNNYSYPIEIFDMVLSFDQGDCEKYGFIYHPLVFSYYHGGQEDLPCSDVYFLGQAKDRLEEILSVYEFLRNKGLKCDFHITNVLPEKQRYIDEIDYNSLFSYEKNLQHVLHSKCVLEIMQHGGLGMTQRAVEIVGLDKMLLTNSARIKEAPFYNPECICQFSSLSDINDSFIEKIKMGVKIKYDYKKNLSPLNLLDFIDERL